MESSLFWLKRFCLERRLVIPLVVLLVFSLAGCSGSRLSDGGGESSEVGGEGSESGGESSEGGGESSEGGGEESGAQLGLTDTFDMVRNGARLELRYDAATQTFKGTVTNTTNAPLSSVRVEVHLSNGVELGPTTPVDLQSGGTADVTLDASGQTFDGWTPHAEVGSGSGGTASATGVDALETSASSLGGWATMDGVGLGIENQGYDLRAWYTLEGDVWTPHLSPSAPEHQPTEAATWTGEWMGYYGDDPAIDSGEARVTVTLDDGTKATLALDDVPTLGTLQWEDMPVSDGRFTGTITTPGSKTYEATGQFGGPSQAGVAGHASGSDLRSVFYGQKPE